MVSFEMAMQIRWAKKGDLDKVRILAQAHRNELGFVHEAVLKKAIVENRLLIAVSNSPSSFPIRLNMKRTFERQFPLETFLLKTLRNEGQVKTVSIGRHNKKVKSIEVIQLRKSARQQGYLAEEVDEALELLNFRQYIQREPDGTVHEFAGAIDAEELVHQAEDLRGRFELLAVYFRGELNYPYGCFISCYFYRTSHLIWLSIGQTIKTISLSILDLSSPDHRYY